MGLNLDRNPHNRAQRRGQNGRTAARGEGLEALDNVVAFKLRVHGLDALKNHPSSAARGIAAEAVENALVNGVEVVGSHRLAVRGGNLDSDVRGGGHGAPKVGVQHGKKDEAGEVKGELRQEADIVDVER